ncbi:MAG: heme-copper oxidase subunit III [bacterium]
MTESAVVEKRDEVGLEKDLGGGVPPIIEEPFFDPGDNGANGETGGPLGNAFLAILLFIGADVMLFAGLIGAFVVFRFGSTDWPPPGQPMLPIGVTGVNTGILLASGFTMLLTWRSLRNWNRQTVLKWLTLTAIGGSVFLMVQGYEWLRLIRFGFTLQSSIYGAIFYTLIGCHALHVLGAVGWLLTVLTRLKFKPEAYAWNRFTGIKLIGMVWFLVVALWPVLYGLVYLN